MAAAATADRLTGLWQAHTTEWRDPAQIVSQWREASRIDPGMLAWRVSGAFWEVLGELGITLLVTREYEHLLFALAAPASSPSVSFMGLPHPSGMVADRDRHLVHVASTRNPNQVYSLGPVRDREGIGTLVPLTSRFLPGSLYLHDLALIGGVLHGNAVGWDRVVRLDDDGGHHPVWWPRAVDEQNSAPPFRNHLQLNSIAAGGSLETSFFSASADRVGHRRPGHRNFAVDGRGVIFSGATREPVVRGLTRPHSARLWGDELWVDNSGYGEVGIATDGKLGVVAKLPGWTRGLHLERDHAFVGTSRVIPRFRQYAPGVDLPTSVCGVHIVSRSGGDVLGSLVWPEGNQIFAIEGIPSSLAGRLPFAQRGRRTIMHDRRLFDAFAPDPHCFSTP